MGFVKAINTDSSPLAVQSRLVLSAVMLVRKPRSTRSFPVRMSGLSGGAAAITLFLWAMSAAAQGVETCLPAFTEISAAPELWCQGGAIADLDGDGRPDRAIVRAESRGPNAFKYRIELSLSTRVGSSSFSVAGEEGGLRIVPRDVDGNGTVDLVITSARWFTPVGIWINDGHGSFTEGDPTIYPQSAWTEGNGVSSDNPRETFQATVPQISRSWQIVPQATQFCCVWLVERLAFPPNPPNVSLLAVSQVQSRAPPGNPPEQSR